MAKIYDLVKEILMEVPATRNDDRPLIWEVWRRTGSAHAGVILHNEFMTAVSPESIRRCRQKIQENNPELMATDPLVISTRQHLADQKGTHIYRAEYHGQGALV